MILSDRQYPMLREFIDRGPNHVMSIEDAQSFDQRPFRSMLIRQYIRYKPGWIDAGGRQHRGGFVVTDLGSEAYFQFHETNIVRADPTRPLTAYFDPAVYGLDLKPRPKARAASASEE